MSCNKKRRDIYGHIPPWSLYSTGTEVQSIQIYANENHGFTSDNLRRLAAELLTDPGLGTRSRVMSPFSEEGMMDEFNRACMAMRVPKNKAPPPSYKKPPPPTNKAPPSASKAAPPGYKAPSPAYKASSAAYKGPSPVYQVPKAYKVPKAQPARRVPKVARVPRVVPPSPAACRVPLPQAQRFRCDLNHVVMSM